MIEFKNVSFNYSKKSLFQNLSFEVPKGSICGLLGENGTGKTTILNLIVGALLPKDGSILINNMNTTSRMAEMYQYIYYVPEEFELPAITLTKFVKAYAPFYPNFSHDRFADYITRLRVDTNKRLNKMSMGEQRKALIAFGFATSVNLLLLDEPTNGLDITSKSIFRGMVAEMANEERTIIISTHQIRDLDILLDRIMILDQNDLVVNCSTAEIEKKLYFDNKYIMDKALYSNGAFSIRENLNREDSTINIELLFNAIIDKKGEFKNILNK